MYQRIIVAVDGSPGAATATDLAATLAGLRGGRVTLVSVVESSPGFVSARGEMLRGASASRARFEDVQRAAILRLRRRGLSVDGLIRDGNAADEIARVVRAVSADLLVLGYSSSSASHALGSTASRLARAVSCAALLTPAQVRVPFSRIVIGFDGSPASVQAVETGTALATAFGARLAVAASRDVDDGAARGPLRSLFGRATAPGTRSRVPLEGDPARGLLHLALDSGSQLLVVGSTGIAHPWSGDLGATVDYLLRAAAVPVLVVRLPTVAETVGHVMRREVHTVAPDTTVRQAATMLLQLGIKSLPVVDPDGRPVGIVTLGDLLRRAGVSLRPSMVGGIGDSDVNEYLQRLTTGDRTCRDVMTSEVVTVHPDVPLVDAIWLVTRHHVKRLPVVDADGHVVGIVSRDDLLRTLAGMSQTGDVAARRAVTGRVAADAMQRDFSTVRATAGADETARAVLASSVGRVAVVDEQDRVVGVVSTHDLVPLAAAHSLRSLLEGIAAGPGPREAFLAAVRQRSAHLCASDLMRRDVVTVLPDSPLDAVLRQMMTRGLTRLLVADRSRHLVGVVDRTDVLRAVGPALSAADPD
jgi:CBS domain-containing protein